MARIRVGCLAFQMNDELPFSLTGDLAAGTGSASLTGRVCGVTFSHTLQLT